MGYTLSSPAFLLGTVYLNINSGLNCTGPSVPGSTFLWSIYNIIKFPLSLLNLPPSIVSLQPLEISSGLWAGPCKSERQVSWYSEEASHNLWVRPCPKSLFLLWTVSSDASCLCLQLTLIFFFSETVSLLCVSGWSRIRYVDQAALEVVVVSGFCLPTKCWN